MVVAVDDVPGADNDAILLLRELLLEYGDSALQFFAAHAMAPRCFSITVCPFTVAGNRTSPRS